MTVTRSGVRFSEARGPARHKRLMLVALDLAAVACAMLFVLLARSAARDFDPLSADRLVETAADTLPVWLVVAPVTLALCGRYSAWSEALELRRSTTAALLAGGVVSIWSFRTHQPWWLFVPVGGSLASIVALAFAARVARSAMRHFGKTARPRYSAS